MCHDPVDAIPHPETYNCFLLNGMFQNVTKIVGICVSAVDYGRMSALKSSMYGNDSKLCGQYGNIIHHQQCMGFPYQDYWNTHGLLAPGFAAIPGRRKDAANIA